MRGLTSTIALLVVLAGLGAYIYFVDSERPAGGLEEKQKVFAVESDRIQEVRLTTDNETALLRKENDSWRLVEPAPGDADQTEASSLVSNLATLEINRVVDENASDLSQYGLASPRVKVAFKGGDTTGELHLGDKTATQSDVYAVRSGETRVFLVSAFHETTFAKKPFDLRDKRILQFERDKVDTIEVAHSGPVIQLARTGSDWSVTAPIQARGDYSAIEGLLTRLASTNMTRLVNSGSEALAEYGLDKPQVTITVGGGSARAVLSVGKEEDGAVSARDQGRNLVFLMDATVVADLKKPATEYRDKDLFEFRTFNAARLRITRGSDTYEFEKLTGESGDTWQRVNAGAAPTAVDLAAMDDFLSKLTGLRAQSFADGGLAAPAMTVAASYDGGKFERVRLGTAGSDAAGVREGEPGVFTLDRSSYEETMKAFEAVLAPPKPAS